MILPPLSERSRAFRRLSQGLRALTFLCCLLGVGGAVFRWWSLGQDGALALRHALMPPQALLAGIAPPQAIGPWWQVAGLLIEGLPLSALVYTLWSLQGLCRIFLQGEVFAEGVPRYFRHLGQGFVAMAVTSVLYGAAVTALLSWLAAEQHHGLVAVSVGSFELSLSIMGLMMFLMAHVMVEGQRFRLESEQFV